MLDERGADRGPAGLGGGQLAARMPRGDGLVEREVAIDALWWRELGGIAQERPVQHVEALDEARAVEWLDDVEREDRALLRCRARAQVALGRANAQRLADPAERREHHRVALADPRRIDVVVGEPERR